MAEPGTGEIAPAPTPVAPVPGSVAPVPTPPPATAPTPNPGAPGAVQAPPVTFSLPAAYGGSAAQSFTLGQGRLSKPPVTFTANASFGYDDNLFSADSHPAPTPTPPPGPLEERVIGFRITPPYPPTPIFQTYRGKPAATPTPGAALGVIGSPVSSLTLGMQVQKGTPRTVVTMDLSLGALNYSDRPGDKTDYTGNFDMALIHKLTPRATVSLETNFVYQKTPDFALLNAPTNNGNGGNYLNGTMKIDLTYGWSPRVTTVTSYDLSVDLLQSDAANNLFGNTFGTQFRYTVSARNTLTAELRESIGTYPKNPAADNNSTFYLVGLDSFISSKLRNTISAGIQAAVQTTGGSKTLPYFESATTLGLPRGAGLTWTNVYGYQNSGVADELSTSYRTGLSYSQPLTTKLAASLSVAYNHVLTTDSAPRASSFTQDQFQASVSLGYTVSPRLSFSLSYTYIDLLSSQAGSSYQRDQISLGGNYTFR
jgi:hypothetical protein